jgi:hypothetical protein
MLTERDWVMRTVKQLAEFIARALKLAREEKRDQAIALLQGACVDLFGIEYRVLSMVDAKSAIELLGSPARVKAFIELVETMAEAENDALRKEARREHVRQLRAAAKLQGS